MDHHAAGKVVELGAGQCLDPGLHAEMLVPGNALEEGVDQAHDHGRGDQLGPELGAFGNAARDDGGNGGGKGQQKEELDQAIAVECRQLLGAHEKVRAVGHAIAEREINHGGDREVDQDLDQGIDLVLAAHGAQLQKSETGVHGQDHDGAHQNEQGIRALF